MVEYLKEYLVDSDLINAPKIKRTHVYCQYPSKYDIKCLLCGSLNIHWSEFESHVWCYECEKDVLLTRSLSGIFSGPIPFELTKMMGISFDRLCIKTGEIIKQSINEQDRNKYRSTWVEDDYLTMYKDNIENKLLKKD